MGVGGVATGGSTTQVERRSRILDAAVGLASEGGYDAVQMREVSDRAHVALGTLYRYFPSKNHLLVSALDRELDRVEDISRSVRVPGDTAQERMLFICERAARVLNDTPRMAEALTRAFAFADASLEELIDQVGFRLIALIGRTMSGDPSHEPTEEEAEMVHVVSDVWLASLIAWATGRKQPEDVLRSMDTAIRLLVR